MKCGMSCSLFEVVDGKGKATSGSLPALLHKLERDRMVSERVAGKSNGWRKTASPSSRTNTGQTGFHDERGRGCSPLSGAPLRRR